MEYQFEKVEVDIVAIERSKAELDQAVDSKREKEVSTDVDKTYKQLKKSLDEIKSRLEDLKGKVESGAVTLDEKEKEIILTKVGAYYVELKNKLTHASGVYSEFKNKSKSRLAKQVRNIDTNNQYDDQELDRIIDEDPEVLQKMVKQQVLGKASLKMQYAAQDILDKCQGIKTLQRNVRELMDMLKEISQIVQLQGEQVNSIAAHCDAAKNHMVSANKNLEKAKEHHSGMRCVG